MHYFIFRFQIVHKIGNQSYENQREREREYRRRRRKKEESEEEEGCVVAAALES
jgi:hypothetical protein